MRGNSQCDPISSMSVVDNRILINTEVSVILMEFEQVQYDYGSASTIPEENTEANQIEEAKRAASAKKPKNYAQIRASRSEFVATPNVKLFNDDRKTILEHSTRPISAKNLKDAQIVAQASSKPMNISRNSVGNISEFGLQKRESIVQSINATIVSQTSLSVLSHHRGTSFSNINQTSKEKKIESRKENLEKELETFRNKTGDLNETKQYLREQLKDIKQSLQNSPSDENSTGKNSPSNINSVETKSCIETRLLNRAELLFKRKEDSEFSFNRPTSSPSRVDTKTRIRLKQHDINKIRSQELEEKFNNILKENESKKNKSAIFYEEKQEELIEESEPYVEIIKPQKIISKIFEIQEKELKTNSSMHPANIKSKVPNPTFINPIILKQNAFKKENRTKSAYLNTSNELTPIFFNRPKTNISKQKGKPIYTPDPYETSKLASSDQLNLMTFRQVERIISTLNGVFAPQKSKENENEFYKKIWTLKSTGKYHGSLLAKPKTDAPEIRE